jgi:hypothetical protein
MSVRDFESGYWYREQLKDFAERIGIPAATKLRKGRTRKGHRGVPAHGQCCAAHEALTAQDRSQGR